MTIRTIFLLIFTHVGVGVAGFALGIYALPILIAPPAPSEAQVSASSSKAQYSAEFVKDLRGSDALHWGEGTVSVGDQFITLMGKLSPGPDYKLYLSPSFVEDEAEFEASRSSMVRVGDVKTFENFVVNVSPDIDPSQYTTVVVWCETFSEFITAAKYR